MCLWVVGQRWIFLLLSISVNFPNCGMIWKHVWPLFLLPLLGTEFPKLLEFPWWKECYQVLVMSPSQQYLGVGCSGDPGLRLTPKGLRLGLGSSKTKEQRAGMVSPTHWPGEGRRAGDLWAPRFRAFQLGCRGAVRVVCAEKDERAPFSSYSLVLHSLSIWPFIVVSFINQW